MHWQRTLFNLCLAVVEVAPAALLVTIAGGNVWAMLLGVALLGALVGWLTENWLPESTERPVLLVVGMLLGVLAFLNVSGSGADIIGAVNQAGGYAYITLLATIYVFWRGTKLPEHDSVTVGRFFNRAVAIIVAILMLGALGSSLSGGLSALAGWELISFFGGGLLAIALAHMANDQGGLPRIEWRSVATLAATIGVVIVGAVLVASLFGGFAYALLSGIAQVLGFAAALLLAPFAFVLSWLLERFVAVFGNSAIAQILAQRAEQLTNNNRQLGPYSQSPPWVGVLLNVLCFVVPLLLLVTIILLRRRRARRDKPENEQRESLFSWTEISSGLGDLLAGLRGRREKGGLRDALAQLVGTDPVSRIRRSYIRLLLHAEARERVRAASQTPREFAPAAGSATNARQQVDTLTRAYERARYAPSTTTQAQAEQAEQAWRQVEGEGTS